MLDTMAAEAQTLSVGGCLESLGASTTCIPGSSAPLWLLVQMPWKELGGAPVLKGGDGAGLPHGQGSLWHLWLAAGGSVSHHHFEGCRSYWLSVGVGGVCAGGRSLSSRPG